MDEIARKLEAGEALTEHEQAVLDDYEFEQSLEIYQQETSRWQAEEYGRNLYAQSE